jgi:hypothetical protein
MQNVKAYINKPRLIGLAIVSRMTWLPDELFLRLKYYFTMGSRLNLKHPQLFQEKIQWLKLYDRKPEYTRLVDKYAVKDYVANMIGDKYIIPTLGVWERFDDINFNLLPNRFVLKTTHGGGGGGVVICKNKSSFDPTEAKKHLELSLKQDIYKYLREWPYKNVPRRIIAEELLETPEKTDLYDYKFFCFNGKVEYFKIDFGRFKEHHANYYDCNANLMPFGEADLPPVPKHQLDIPDNLADMIALAETLSKGFTFIRIDLYNLSGRIYFGEMTFYPASGLGPFTSKEWDLKIGESLKLSAI